MKHPGYRFKYSIVDLNERVLELGMEWENTQLLAVVKGEQCRLRKWSDMNEETFVLTMRERAVTKVDGEETRSYRYIILWMVAKGDFFVRRKDEEWHDSEKKAREMAENYLNSPRDVIDGIGKDVVIIQERIESTTIRYRFL